MSSVAGTGLPSDTTDLIAQTDPPFHVWFGAFLREELGPYPGRANMVIRMAIAATITMLIIMTFRLPAAAIAAYYTLLLSRDSPQTTLRAAFIVLGAYLSCAAFVMVGILFFVDEPLTHFLFVVFSLFLSFFIIKVSTNYVGAAGFAFTIAVVIPIWDTHLPTNVLVTSTLWAATSVSVGLAATVAVEYAFNLFDPRDPLLEGIDHRLRAVAEVLRQCCDHESAASLTRHIEQYGTVGVSRLRRLAVRSRDQAWHSTRGTAVVSLTGRLIDLCNATWHIPGGAQTQDMPRFHALATQIDALRALLKSGGVLHSFEPPHFGQAAVSPLLPELERTVQMLALALTEPAHEGIVVAPGPESAEGIFVRDAFTNPEHTFFSLRGCLAASLCYMILNSIDWRGLNTAIATCIVTALSSVGSSRQKQLLRLVGALIGGLIFGIGSQVFVLPMLDGIGGFAVLFAVVTIVAAWIATASTRLSYLGLQVALAFYLIHLQEFEPQTNLAIARDRVMGIALGLAAMWLVFDRLGTRPASQVMTETFIANLRLLAQLAEPWPLGQPPLDRAHIAALRDRAQANFASVNAQADAVFLEVGPQRRIHLEWRSNVRAWQPSLRSFLVIQIALLQYRLEVSPSQLAPAIVDALRALDGDIKRSLNALADSLEQGRPAESQTDLSARLLQLQEAIDATYPVPTLRARAVLSLSSHLISIVDSLRRDVHDKLARRVGLGQIALQPATDVSG